MTIIERLQAEADQCRQDGANDIARLLDDAVEEQRDHERAYALLFAECGKLRQRAEAAELDAVRYRWLSRRVSAHGVIDGWSFGFPTHLTLPAPALAIRNPEEALGQAIDAQRKEQP